MGCRCTKYDDPGSDTAMISHDDVYDGEKNCFGQKHGYGEFLYSNGDIYRGCWKYNKMHGAGVYTPLFGEIKDGFFRDGAFIGKHWDQPNAFIEKETAQPQPLIPEPVYDEQLEAKRAQRKLESEKRQIEFKKERDERRKRREEFYKKYPKRLPVERYGTIQR